MGSVLALDLSATRTGFAVAARDSALASGLAPAPAPHFGTKSFRKGSDVLDAHGLVYERVERWLLDMIAVHGIDMIVMEAPLVRQDMSARLLLGISAVVDLVATRKGIAIYEVHNATLKKFATGMGNADKRMMIDAARRKWGDVDNSDAADALHCLDYALHKVSRWQAQQRASA